MRDADMKQTTQHAWPYGKT